MEAGGISGALDAGVAAANSADAQVSEARLEEEFGRFFLESETIDEVLEDDDE